MTFYLRCSCTEVTVPIPTSQKKTEAQSGPMMGAGTPQARVELGTWVSWVPGHCSGTSRPTCLAPHCSLWSPVHSRAEGEQGGSPMPCSPCFTQGQCFPWSPPPRSALDQLNCGSSATSCRDPPSSLLTHTHTQTGTHAQKYTHANTSTDTDIWKDTQANARTHAHRGTHPHVDI